MQKKNKNAAIKLTGLRYLSLLRLLVLMCLPAYLVITKQELLADPQLATTKDKIVFGICAAIWGTFFVLKDTITRSERKNRNDLEFDENGMSVEYNELQSLSKEERKEIAKQKLAEMERLFGTGTLRKVTKEGSDNPDKDLESLIGLLDVKKRIREMNARMEYDIQKQKDEGRKKKNRKKISKEMISSMHMCFFGPAGTGKTTCAKIMTGYLYRNGYIDKNEYIEIDGNFLRGQTSSDTTEKTRLILNAAKGKVLFIDEAYALLSSYDSQEAVATLIKTMEDERNDFILIMAGYEDEMKSLINSNPGFFSRISQYLFFRNYTNQELCDIFSFMANEHNLYVPAETIDRFSVRIANEEKQRYFGNARTCRNVLDEAVSRHALNLKEKIIEEDKRYMLCPEDIDVNARQKMA